MSIYLKVIYFYDSRQPPYSLFLILPVAMTAISTLTFLTKISDTQKNISENMKDICDETTTIKRNPDQNYLFWTTKNKK
jgi:hypothetical protein